MFHWRIASVAIISVAFSALPLPGGGDTTQPAGANGLSIRIAVPERCSPPLRGDRPTLHVVFENTSASPQRIFEEDCSAGYFNLTLDYTDRDGTNHPMRKKDVSWRANGFWATTIQPGQCLVRDIYFDDKWTGAPKLSPESRLTFTATFKEEDHAGRLWHGTIQSPPMQLFGSMVRPNQ